MKWQSTPYVLLLFVAALPSLLWALYGIWMLRSERGETYLISFVVLCVAVSIWATVYAIQLASLTLDAKLLAYNVLHIGGVAVPPAWLVFAVTYTGRSERLKPTILAGIVAIPLALLLTLPTNPHSLALTGASLETHGSVTVLVTGDGPLYLLYLAYSYVLIISGACLIVAHAARSPTLIRRQSALLVTGAVVPLVLNVLNVLTTPTFGEIGVNLTPVSLSFSTILFGTAIFRYRMLDLIPVAWDVVLAQMSDGVIVLNDHERIVGLNSAAEALVGNSDTVLGENASSLLPQYNCLKQDRPFLISLTGANNDDRSIQLTRSPLTKYGETYGWVVLAQDVTVLERQRRELEQQNTRLDRFSKVVAHDLRNPLAVIDGYAELAEQTGEGRHFDTIHDTASRMETFLDELLLLSRQGKIVKELQPVSLATVVEAVSEEFADDRLLVDVASNMIVMADEDRLRQMLDNLLRNARDHNDDNVAVKVGELPDGFYIEDDGLGIPPEIRQSVFETGFSTRSNGTGFGLAIIRDIVDAHGWKISVTDAATGGARFEITGVDFSIRE